MPEYEHSRYLRIHTSYKKMFNEYNIHNYINSLKKYFLFCNIQNIADISYKLIFYNVFKFMKKNVNSKPSQEYKSMYRKYNTILLQK